MSVGGKISQQPEPTAPKTAGASGSSSGFQPQSVFQPSLANQSKLLDARDADEGFSPVASIVAPSLVRPRRRSIIEAQRVSVTARRASAS
jgi:hypothetical protein